MTEVTITGLNSITYPTLHAWDWRVAIYLFLGGLTAGILVMSAVANLRKWPDSATGPQCERGAMFAPFILAVGMFFIFLDLERKTNVYWFYLTLQPKASMSWGAWGIMMIIPLSFLYALSTAPPALRHSLKFSFLINLSEKLRPYHRKLAILNFGLGIFLGIYTGVLLSSMMARPLWNSSLLPVLFLTSALSTGAAFLIIIASRTTVKLFYTKLDIWLIVAEIMIILLFFYGQYHSTANRMASIMPFFTLNHEFFIYFVAIFLVSILLPLALVIKLFEMREDHAEEISDAAVTRMNISAIMVLLGGFIIRLSLIYAGQLSRFI
jgi:formate-dependent nitrite reductase membrane component NrfD